MNNNLTGTLPVINEQIRYNEELMQDALKNGNNWVCARCLRKNSNEMPDLKQICKPCPNQFPGLKPRKVLNRLPDIDMWMVCDDSKVEVAKTRMAQLFDSVGMHTSDVDPVQTIHDVDEIARDLGRSIMPKKLLPLDVHIIECSKLEELISRMPFTLQEAMAVDEKPYLPIHPHSLRKTWQKDDEAYNFVLDFMYTLTPFNWDDDLKRRLDFSRSVIASEFGTEGMENILHKVASPAVERRLQTQQLQDCYKERVESWKRR